MAYPRDQFSVPQSLIYSKMIYFSLLRSQNFNYADDNTVAFTHGVFKTLINTLQSDSISY